MKGYPDDRDTLGPSLGQQLAGTMFAPEPPTGPQTPPRTKAMNRYGAYQLWKRSEEGGRAFGWMLVSARRQLAAGARRISTKALVEACRATLRCDLNNSYTSWLADDLLAVEPLLESVIERRVRKKARA